MVFFSRFGYIDGVAPVVGRAGRGGCGRRFGFRRSFGFRFGGCFRCSRFFRGLLFRSLLFVLDTCHRLGVFLQG